MRQSLRLRVWQRTLDALKPRARNYVPFIVLGQMRTGSNLLRVALQSSPEIRMQNEIFNRGFRRPGASFETILGEWLTAAPRVVRAVGCKVFYDHLDDAEWSRLLAVPNLRVIHLRRRNRLRMFLSLTVAAKTGHWIEDRPRKQLAVEQRRVDLEIPRLIRFLEVSAKREEEARSRVAHTPVLDVAFEDLRDGLGDVIPAVLQFLGAHRWNPGRVDLRRQNPEPAHSLIRNYEQVARALETSRWRRFLVED